MFSFSSVPPPNLELARDLTPRLQEIVTESVEKFRQQLGPFAQPQFIEQYRAEIARVASIAWQTGWETGLTKAFRSERERSEAEAHNDSPEERQNKNKEVG